MYIHLDCNRKETIVGYRLWIILIMVAILVHVEATAPVQAADNTLGVNLSELVDYSDEDPFLDYMKMSREWFGQSDTEFDTNENTKIALDASGWVTSLRPKGGGRFTRVATIMMVGGAPHNNYAGNYVIRYEGKGTMSFGGATVVSETLGRTVVTVNDSAGFFVLRITSTDSRDYLRNIRVVKATQERNFLRGAIFNPVWLAKLTPFGVVRFMDWMRTNGSGARPFVNRANVTDARYTTSRGAPIEVMIALANKLNVRPWFNMPAQANDDYMRLFATIVRDRLARNITVYIEYSNEVWNTGGPFHPQGSYIDQQALAEFGSSVVNDNGFYTARMNWHGKRTAEMCRIWKKVFGRQAHRVVCTLGAQAANTFTAEEALSCPLWRADANNTMPTRRCQAYGIDAVAIAPYFGSYVGDDSWDDQVETWNADTLFAEINSGGNIIDPVPGDFNDPPPAGAMAEALSWMQDYKTSATTFNYRLLAYEGGQHLAAIGDTMNNTAVTNLFIAANRDSRMTALYDQYIIHWKANSSEAMVFFYLAGRYSEFGNWGLLEYIEQPASPKYTAIIN